MLAVLKARSWPTVMIVSAVGTLITASGPERLLPFPLLSAPLPVALVLTVISATACVIPLLPPFEPLDATFVRNARLNWLRPLLTLVVASPPSVVAVAAGQQDAQATEVARLLLLSATGLLVVTVRPDAAWMVPLTLGLASVIVDGSDPARPVAQGLLALGTPGAACLWLCVWIGYGHVQRGAG